MFADVLGPVCMYQPRPVRPQRTPTPVDDREKAWANLKPLSEAKAPIKQTGFVAPLGALEGLDHFVAKIEAINRMQDQQMRDAASHRVIVEADKEMATIIDEFRANGFHAVSLSSSSLDSEDDDLEAANIADHHLKTVPYAFGIKGYTEPDEFGTQRPIYRGLDELAPILRRIDWEKTEAKHGPVVSVILTDADGVLSITLKQAWMAKKIDAPTMKRMALKLIKGAGITDVETLHNNRAFAEHYGAVGSALYGVHRGPSVPEQSFDDLGADEWEKPNANGQGPQELGMHWLNNDLEEEVGPELIVLPARDELDEDEFDIAI